MPGAPSLHSQREWQISTADPEAVRAVVTHLGCPLPIAHLLVSRGISTADQADAFLHPELGQLHSPNLMSGMERAVRRIQHAVTEGEPILIYGDYDVDGTIATVLLITAINRIAPAHSPARVSWHIPHRIRDGYGMQPVRLAEAAREGVRLVISVDTGIRAFAAAEEARLLGLDLIVTDHHIPDDKAGLPEAVAILNPAQSQCTYPFRSLCGAAVSYKLAHALLHSHAEAASDPEAQILYLNQRLLPSLLKLVAIATIADSVPLLGENRVLVSLGLRELANPIQPGLRELMRVAGLALDRSPTAAEVGFRIAPRINAAGRMDVADDVIELFLTRSTERAQELAEKLDRMNEDRRATEREALEDIEQRLATIATEHSQYPPEPIVFAHPDWHRGVIGILAARIAERTDRPALVLTHDDVQAHGSGRSVPGFHLLNALTSVHEVRCDKAPSGELFTRFGGHSHAVGFSLPASHVQLLRDRLTSHARSFLSTSSQPSPLFCDAVVPRECLSDELTDWAERCAPFGNENPEPVFVTRSLILSKPPRVVKDRHLCLQFTPSIDGCAMQAMGWSRRIDWPAHSQDLRLNAGTAVDVVYRLKVSSGPWFSGLELELLDLRTARDQN